MAILSLLKRLFKFILELIVGEKTLKRAINYGVGNILISRHMAMPAVIIGFVLLLWPEWFTDPGMRNFVESATGAAQSIIAVTLSGLAILVSLSSQEFLDYFEEKGGYDKLLFIFEYTVLLSLITTAGGILLQSVSFERWTFCIFAFLFIHLLFSVAALVSTIIRFAKSRSRFSKISDMNGDEIPQKAKDDMHEAVEKAEDN